jgi:SAM-dependent methyltransferase
MFDWARGSMLKKFIELELFFADWRRVNFLKNWHTPWLLGLIEFTPQMCVLDVGSATPHFMKYLHFTYGCEVHALDASADNASHTNWGFQTGAVDEFPEVTMHVGLAGQDLLPDEKFDVITCISTLEHTYDHESPLLMQRPMPHLHAMRDIIRMLKPGGVFLMNWDLFLDNLPQHIGWDFEVDYQILHASGMRLLSRRRRLRNAASLFSHPDTLFYNPVKVLGFKFGQLRRGTAINMLWQKPGNVANVRISPRPELESLYFPTDESCDEPPLDSAGELTTAQIDERLRHLIARATDVLGRTDV